MSKRIAKVEQRHFGHAVLEFEDGSRLTMNRGDHEKHALKAGDYWPLRTVGRHHAVDTKAGKKTAKQRLSSFFGSEGEDEERAAREPEARSRKERE
jgi:hypothetical protein